MRMLALWSERLLGISGVIELTETVEAPSSEGVSVVPNGCRTGVEASPERFADSIIRRIEMA